MNGTPQARGPVARAAVILAAAILVAGCSTTPAGGTPGATAADSGAPATATPTAAPVGPSQAEIDKALSTPTTITYWSWDLSAKASVEAFQKLHPAITIKYENVGVGPGEYEKLRTAVTAGTGVPDVVFMEGAIIPGFALTDSLLDLATLGAASLKDQFLPGTWGPVALGDHVYGLPVGANVVVNYYRADLFEKAGITAPPATWEEFAADAKVIKEKTGAAMTTLSVGDPTMMLNNFFQAGAVPFDWEPGSKNVKISLNSPEMKKVAAFWNAMVQDGTVAAGPTWVDTWWQEFQADKIATWQAGVWGSPVLAGTTKTSGKWRVSEWPQWTAGGKAGAVWAGGIADVVMKTSQNPIVAYEFLKFRATDPAFATEKFTKWGWDPVLKSALADPAWLAFQDAVAGNQKVNEVVAEVSANIGPAWHYLPFMEFVYQAQADTLGKAASEKTDLSAALDAWQQKVVDYATQQGFTVIQ